MASATEATAAYAARSVAAAGALVRKVAREATSQALQSTTKDFSGQERVIESSVHSTALHRQPAKAHSPLTCPRCATADAMLHKLNMGMVDLDSAVEDLSASLAQGSCTELPSCGHWAVQSHLGLLVPTAAIDACSRTHNQAPQ